MARRRQARRRHRQLPGSSLVYVLSGRTKAVLDDGTEIEAGPGDVAYIPAGHDGWTVGDEPCVIIDFAGMARYAQPG